MHSCLLTLSCVVVSLTSALSQNVSQQSLFRATAPADNAQTAAKIELGRELFHSGILSDNGNVSCATCHDPGKGFSDGRDQAVGVAGFPVGRNSASLTVTGLMKKFPGIEQVKAKGSRRVVSTRPAVLSLEARCLAPISNAVEMGASVDKVVKKLRRKEGMNKTFDRTFNNKRGGVTEERLGKALAAYLRSLEPAPNSPYRRYLEGEQRALTSAQQRGLRVFNGRGRCNRCHSGPALTDGLVHVASLPGGKRTREQARVSRTRVRKLMQDLTQKKATGREKKRMQAQMQVLVGSGPAYYGPNPQVGGQTPSLWNISQTAPYFRDGSAQDLAGAVKQHIDELQEVALEERRLRSHLRQRSLMASVTAPKEIRVKWDRVGPTLPDDLDPREMRDLLAFLRTL